MQKGQYVEVKTSPIQDKESEVIPSKIFLKQLFVCSGIWTAYFIAGLGLGSATVIVPQLRREANSTDAVSIEEASWMSSIGSYVALPAAAFLTAVTEPYGRKWPFLFTNLTALIGYIVFLSSRNLRHLFIWCVIQGFIFGSNITISIVLIPEYTSPRYRGWFLPVKTASNMWGMWVANAIGTFFHWKCIGVVGIIASIYNLITISFWPESPVWLASKGLFEKCAQSNRWLKGCSESSEMELESLIKHQKDYIYYCKEHEAPGFVNKWNTFFKVVSSREYYKPMLLSVTCMSLYIFSGKQLYAIYAIDIIKRISDSESAAYTGMLILDGITVLGTYTGCYLARILKRRTIMLLFSSLGVILLYTISLYLYLVKLGLIVENKYVSLILLSAFSLSVSCGPMIMVATIFAEITPLKFRSFSLFLYAAYFQTMFATLLKTGPYMFIVFEMFGTFLFFAVACSLFTLILYLYLPETKGKTTQEIIECMKN